MPHNPGKCGDSALRERFHSMIAHSGGASRRLAGTGALGTKYRLWTWSSAWSRCRWRWRSRSPPAPSPSKGMYTAIVAGLLVSACRRQSVADRRADRRFHRHSLRHHRPVRHRRLADRNVARRCDVVTARHGAAGRHHQVHSRSGDPRVHRRHRRRHLDRTVAGFLRPAGGHWPALPRKALAHDAGVAAGQLATTALGDGDVTDRPVRAAAAVVQARARAVAGLVVRDRRAGDVSFRRCRHDRLGVRRHSARPAVAALAGNHCRTGHRADRARVHDRHARRHRVVAVGGGCRRHGRHAPRLQSGVDRAGHRQHRGAIVRRLRGDGRVRKNRDQCSQRRFGPARRHRACVDAGAHRAGAGAAGGEYSIGGARGDPVRGRLEHERGAALRQRWCGGRRRRMSWSCW